METKSKNLVVAGLSNEKIELIKRTVCQGATNDELELFIYVCQKCGLDPFMKQIYSVKRGNVRTIQTSIDGLRLIADRSGNYSPGREATYSYNENGQLVAATAYLKKRTSDGTWHEVSATAFYHEFKPKNGNNFWNDMPHVMLAKCAESAALRKAFPAEMSGIYSDVEMSQASVVEEPITFEQSEEILELIGDDKALLGRILERYRADAVTDLKTAQFPAIVNNLRSRRQVAVAV